MAKIETVGKASFDLMQKEHMPASPVEYEREMHKEYEKEVLTCIDYHKKFYGDDFYVVVLRKRERLMANVYRSFFLGRKSCPTPTYDQTVYKYNYVDDALEFLWTLPDLETCTIFKGNPLDIAPEERDLLRMILDFYDGTLDKKVTLLNNEFNIIEG